MDRVECEVLAAQVGMRIDLFVAGACAVSRAAAQRLIEDGNVLVEGKKPAKSLVLAAGQRLAITIPLPAEPGIQAQDIPLDICYEDDHLLVVNKPKGMVVHPAAGNPDCTLVNALMFHCKGSLSGIGGELRPGIVHRIDKDTSGLLVVAKNDSTHQGLSEQFARHSISRVYQAVVYGRLKEKQGQVEAAIGRSRNDRKKMAVSDRNGKHAVTGYSVVAEYPSFSHIELRLQTGRTHQIRVHMAALGHPVAGDAVYGPKKVIKRLHGQCLHAGLLGFIHPHTGQYMEFDSLLPPYFTDFLKAINNGMQDD